MKEHMKDISHVWSLNMAVLGVVTLADIEVALRVALLGVSLAFTLWKWHAALGKRSKRNKS